MNRVATAGLFGLTLIVASAASADHNSPHGEGWARMPNDIHNTRIDTLGSGNDAFTNFVRYGNGADSVNRFSDGDSRGHNRGGYRTQTRSRMRNMAHSGSGSMHRRGMGGGRGGR
ncbi:MAG: hypothetical protein P8Z31_01285 [Gammaproteobacteria bacterium]|jgi:hypothetical protein